MSNDASDTSSVERAYQKVLNKASPTGAIRTGEVDFTYK